MKAYGVFAGGGVKGAALAGCYEAARTVGFEFAGVGGCSAGSIVAFLVALGHSPAEVESVMMALDFSRFLDDGGTALREAKTFFASITASAGRKGALSGAISFVNTVRRHRGLLARLRENLGLYDAGGLSKFLVAQAKLKLGTDACAGDDLTFGELSAAPNSIPLKIIASDLFGRRPSVFSNAGGEELNGSVVSAVRASMSYPIVFRPVQYGIRPMADGGLATNLPIFLFERERAINRLPVIAFDLESNPPDRSAAYNIRAFAGDLLGTALESGDLMQQRLLQNVHHVRVPVPSDIGTLDFHLSPADKRRLFDAGKAAVLGYFAKALPQWGQANSEIEHLQAMMDVPPPLLTRVLSAVARDVAGISAAREVRAQIMLPTGRGTRIVVYSFGMDRDPDSDLELAANAGCSGLAWTTRLPACADLADAKANFGSWGMTREQQNKVRSDRASMMSVPIFDPSNPTATRAEDLGSIGVLSVDSTTPLDATEWNRTKRQVMVECLQSWADIIATILR